MGPAEVEDLLQETFLAAIGTATRARRSASRCAEPKLHLRRVRLALPWTQQTLRERHEHPLRALYLLLVRHACALSLGARADRPGRGRALPGHAERQRRHVLHGG